MEELPDDVKEAFLNTKFLEEVKNLAIEELGSVVELEEIEVMDLDGATETIETHQFLEWSRRGFENEIVLGIFRSGCQSEYRVYTQRRGIQFLPYMINGRNIKSEKLKAMEEDE